MSKSTQDGADVVERDDVLSTLDEWRNTLRQWSGSAFIAGEDVGDTDGACEQLYVDLCRLGNETAWMEEQITRLRSDNERLREALRGCVSFRNWEIAEGGVTPDGLRDVWKRAEDALQETDNG